MNSRPIILVCLTTVSNQNQAREMARALLDQRVAACVQIDGPIESHYRWQGEDCCESEFRLVIKTSVEQKDRLREFIRDVHPYDQPQIVTLESVDVEAGYAAWVNEETTGRRV
ncbi:MAG: divalent-cation tolerance protein CutA [Planctomycetales bacterium]|nr:divalent-cation tolerance protein CutA [Planctomycetales bacterium]